MAGAGYNDVEFDTGSMTSVRTRAYNRKCTPKCTGNVRQYGKCGVEKRFIDRFIDRNFAETERPELGMPFRCSGMHSTVQRELMHRPRSKTRRRPPTTFAIAYLSLDK
ncbi:phosphoglucomutase [Anopheles sinensis]|uniref:Phosphoglucomutase n=1 Tax=Anopheles sinensis TaxID=74873 RepID=A0A084WLW9_ANOSI|nr:phosphoglucomutase [Anopheles sinensis]